MRHVHLLCVIHIEKSRQISVTAQQCQRQCNAIMYTDVQNTSSIRCLKSLESFHFGASLVFTLVSISKRHIHTHVDIFKVFQGYCWGIFCKLISRAVLCVRGNEWSESAPCCCYFNPQLIHTRSLQTSNITLNIIFSFQCYQTQFKFPETCKGWSSYV